jgi:hypothetical protein
MYNSIEVVGDNCSQSDQTGKYFSYHMQEGEGADELPPELAAAPAPTPANIMGSWSVSATAHCFEKMISWQPLTPLDH